MTQYDATATATTNANANAPAPAPAIAIAIEAETQTATAALAAPLPLPLARPRRCVTRTRADTAANGPGRPGAADLTATGAARSYHVFDGRGEILGSFSDWDNAHAFAHNAVALPQTATPVEVDDRRQRLSRRVWAHRCEFVTWTTVRRSVSQAPDRCEHPPAA